MNPYKLLSIQVGVVQPLFVDPHRVMSGIRKHPVQGAVRVHPLGIDGDEQADLTVHGGLSKAIYAYPGSVQDTCKKLSLDYIRLIKKVFYKCLSNS